MRFKLDENLGRRHTLRPGPPPQGRTYAFPRMRGANRKRQFDIHMNGQQQSHNVFRLLLLRSGLHPRLKGWGGLQDLFLR